jgi:hypothetical protein
VWFERAASAGFIPSAFNAAALYEQGMACGSSAVQCNVDRAVAIYENILHVVEEQPHLAARQDPVRLIQTLEAKLKQLRGDRLDETQVLTTEA